MPHLGTHLAPGAGGGAIGKLDEVERVLDVGLQTVERHLLVAFVLATQPHAENGKRPRTDVFAKLEEFVESEATRLVVVGESTVLEGVVPAVLVERTVFHGPHRVLPLIAGGERVSLHHATAGETHHAGMQVAQGFHQIAAKAVGTLFPSVGGKEGQVVEINATCLTHHDTQAGLGLGEGRTEDEFIGLPLGIGHLERAFAQRGPVGTDEFHVECGEVGGTVAGIDAEAVVGTLPEADAAESLIVEPRAGKLGGLLQMHVVRIALKAGLLVAHTDLAEGCPSHQVLGKLEGTVFHQFGIQTAVGTEVDVLEKDAVHAVVGLGHRASEVDTEVNGRIGRGWLALGMHGEGQAQSHQYGVENVSHEV